MENVDKDIARMLKAFKHYDILKESSAPVLEKKGKPEWLLTAEEKAEKKEGKDDADEDKDDEKDDLDESGQPWETSAEKDDDERKEEPAKDGMTHKGGKVTHSEKGLVHKGGSGYGNAKQKEVELEEGADPEILAWMKRFNMLGKI
jgi:hypothetical protein